MNSFTSSLCPTDGLVMAVGDGAATFNTFSTRTGFHAATTTTALEGGPGVSTSLFCLRSSILTKLCSGVFDVDKQKCPLPRGSLDCVTGSPASYPHDIPTPPLTPENGRADDAVLQARPGALLFLRSLFPNHALSALPYATPIPADARLSFAVDGFVLNIPGRAKTLYVRCSLPANVSLRDR